MMGASWVLPTTYVLAAAEGSTHNYLLMAGNLHEIGYFSRKHPWVLPGCFLLRHHQQVIVYIESIIKTIHCTYDGLFSILL